MTLSNGPVQPYSPKTKISQSLSRIFGYRLSDKKATSNLLKSASREPFEIEEKQKCSLLLFSAGAYVRTVLPLISEWKNMKEVELGSNSIDTIKVVPGFDESMKHIDTVISFLFNGKKSLCVALIRHKKSKLKV